MLLDNQSKRTVNMSKKNVRAVFVMKNDVRAVVTKIV